MEVEVVPPNTKRRASIPGPVLRVGQRKLSRATCRDEVLAAMHRLAERTGDEVFTVARIFAEMGATGTSYKLSAVYKTMQRMKDPNRVGGHPALERQGQQGFRLRTDTHIKTA